MPENQGIIAITDEGWYEFLRHRSDRTEVNFWKPSARRAMHAAEGTPFLFKLRSPHNAICGFGFFARYARLPIWLAWDAFDEGNGCGSLDEMNARVEEIRERIRYRAGEYGDQIGCVLIAQPVFFPPEMWVAQPGDWPPRTQTDKRYALDAGEGARVWRECLDRAGLLHPSGITAERRYGDPILVRPRHGQGIFRIATMEAYGRACAVTGEHSLPALDASHIKPFSDGGPNDARNGLFLRADIHRLFDRGYVTVSTDRRLLVSDRLKEDYRNGRTYYPLHGTAVRQPREFTDRPRIEYLEWHNRHVFLGG